MLWTPVNVVGFLLDDALSGVGDFWLMLSSRTPGHVNTLLLLGRQEFHLRLPRALWGAAGVCAASLLQSPWQRTPPCQGCRCASSGHVTRRAAAGMMAHVGGGALAYTGGRHYACGGGLRKEAALHPAVQCLQGSRNQTAW